MLFHDDDPILQSAHHWVEKWAAKMRQNRAEIMSELGHPPTTTIGERASTNYSVSEDDRQGYYERHDERQVAIMDALLTDLWRTVPWAFWAICRKHRLGNMGMLQYERLAKGGMIPPGLYSSALEEVSEMMGERGLV